MKYYAFAILSFILICGTFADSAIVEDTHSYAKPAEASVKHVDLDLIVDFQKKQLIGRSTLTIQNHKKVNRIYLDSQDLQISKVTLGKEEQATTFIKGKLDKVLGEAVIVSIKPETQIVNVYYSTSPNAGALQWLTPQQTHGKKHPYLFTQCQAIRARSIVPLQDSPSVRITYSARLKVPKDLLALMSAENPTEKNDTGIYTFAMRQPIPSYLIAIAVGDIEFRPLGKITGVYAESGVIEEAATGLKRTERMVEMAGKLYGPYRWDRYDILVLPPAFPYFGMENPRLTFITPTVLHAESAMENLIAHELAHSWSGNLVTNATWNDFWLNEGFTTYFGHRIMAELYGKEWEEMQYFATYEDLIQEMERVENKNDHRLFIDLKGRDPEEGVSSIPYSRGTFFLETIESYVGGEVFDKFLREYFDAHAFQSVTTSQFLAYLRSNLVKRNKELEEKLRIDQWVFSNEIPSNMKPVNKNVFHEVYSFAARWSKGEIHASEIPYDKWNYLEQKRFYEAVPKELSMDQLKELDAAFHLSETKNYPIKFEWFRHVIRNNYQPGFAELERFLTDFGGPRYYFRVLFIDLAKTAEGKKMAIKIFEAVKHRYHPVMVETIQRILES